MPLVSIVRAHVQQEPSIEKQLQDLELCLLEPGVRKSQRVAELLVEEFVEFGSSGRTFTKEQVIAALQSETTTQYTATQFTVRLLAPHIGLVTYLALRHTEPPVYTLRSSIWEQRHGQWKLVFHQGTPASAPSTCHKGWVEGP